MTKCISLLFSTTFALTSLTATAGIAPNTGGTAMSQSGAKVAAPKPAAEEEHQDEAKDKGK